jgi:N4-gp56 family major capsid protein
MATFTTTQTGPTEMDLILSVVQDELIRAAKLRPTVVDMSSSAEKGVKTIEIPRYDTHFANPAAQNPDGVTPVTSQTVDFQTDSLDLDKWVTLPYEIPDRISRQSRVNLEAELAASAGRTFGKYIDDELIVALRAASAAAPNHRIQLSGGLNDEITLDDITNARELLNKADVKEEDRWLIVSPKQERAMLNISNFIEADKYGAREALLNGEIGRVFGFRVMVHNGLSDDEAIAYQREAVAFAMQKDMMFESRRAQLGLQKTEYAFSAGWGTVTLEQGVKQVLLNATGT